MVALLTRTLQILAFAIVAFGVPLEERACGHVGGCDSFSLLQVTQQVSSRHQAAGSSRSLALPPRSATASSRKLALPPRLTNEVRPDARHDTLGAQAARSFEGSRLTNSTTSTETEGHLLSHVAGDTDLYQYFTPFATNVAALGMLGVAVCAIMLGRCFSQKGSSFPAWMAATLIVCYSMWLLGIFLTNSSMLMVIRLKKGPYQGSVITATTSDPDVEPPVPGVMREYPWAVVHLLMRSPQAHLRFAGFLCCILAFVGPIVRLGCLFAGECLRGKESTVHHARRCLLVVRGGSKWASPVFLLMIIVHCQFLVMDNGVDVATKSALDIGWMGYFVFCFTNLIIANSVTIPSPEVFSNVYGGRDLEIRLRVRQVLAFVVGVAGFCYLWLLSAAIFQGSFSYKLALSPSVRATIPQSVEGTQVSIWQCITLLMSRSFHSRQVMPFFASSAMLIFVVLLPVIDMCALVLICYYASKDDLPVARVSRLLAVNLKTRNCLMSDVLVFAFFLMSISQMVVLHSVVKGLVMAEVIRYIVTYGIVAGGVGVAEYVSKAPACRNPDRQGCKTKEASDAPKKG